MTQNSFFQWNLFFVKISEKFKNMGNKKMVFLETTRQSKQYVIPLSWEF